mgnify:CR=1 FL=1
MNNVFVYIETEGGKVADVSLELLTKGRELADRLASASRLAFITSDTSEMETPASRATSRMVIFPMISDSQF